MERIIPNLGTTFVFFLVAFFDARSMICFVIIDRLKTSTRRKRRKGQTPWQWLTYARYRDVVTKPVLIYYYGTNIFFLAVMLAVEIMRFFETPVFILQLFLTIVLFIWLMHSLLLKFIPFEKKGTVVVSFFNYLDKQYEKKQRKKELRKKKEHR